MQSVDALVAQIRPELAAASNASHWWVAISGGVDSTVLLHLLCRYRDQYPGTPVITAIHVDHRLQPAAASFRDHCTALCERYDVPLSIHRVEVAPGASPESQARDARYTVFESLLAEGDVLWLGHHQDDQVETMLLRLLRGAGPHGAAGMPAHRTLGRGHLRRPLIEVSRSLLKAYAGDHALTWVEDPTNAELTADRNFLRHAVLPVIEERWPGYRETFARHARQLRQLEASLEDRLPPLSVRFNRFGDRALALAALPQDVAGQTAQLRRFILQTGCRAPGSAALEEFRQQLTSGQGAQLKWSTHHLQRFGAAVYLLGAEAAPAPDWSMPVAPGATLHDELIGRLSVSAPADQGLSHSEKLVLRMRRDGDRLPLPGAQGQTTLKKRLQAWGVPPWWRHRVPLLCAGDRVIAVGDRAAPKESAALASPLGWRVHWCPPGCVPD